MWNILKAAFKFMLYALTAREENKQDKKKEADYEANKALLERDRDRAVRRAARVIRAGVLREEASEAPTVSIPANTH